MSSQPQKKYIKKGTMVRLASYKSHPRSLNPGLVIEVRGKLGGYTPDHEWELLRRTQESMANPLIRVHVLHADGQLLTWRPEELVLLTFEQ
jgi:hypothetical protein